MGAITLRTRLATWAAVALLSLVFGLIMLGLATTTSAATLSAPDYLSDSVLIANLAEPIRKIQKPGH